MCVTWVFPDVCISDEQFIDQKLVFSQQSAYNVRQLQSVFNASA